MILVTCHRSLNERKSQKSLRQLQYTAVMTFDERSKTLAEVRQALFIRAFKCCTLSHQEAKLTSRHQLSDNRQNEHIQCPSFPDPSNKFPFLLCAPPPFRSSSAIPHQKHKTHAKQVASHVSRSARGCSCQQRTALQRESRPFAGISCGIVWRGDAPLPPGGPDCGV